jgi:hypothetical protein
LPLDIYVLVIGGDKMDHCNVETFVRGTYVNNAKLKLMVGEYFGYRGGWEASFDFQGETYSVKTEYGVRGFNIPCIIIVTGTEILVKEYNEKGESR